MQTGEKTALLAGASGLTGNELLHFVLESPHYAKVKVLVRKRLSIEHPKLEQIVTDFDRLDEFEDHFHVHDVFCCLGTTIKKAGSQKQFRKVDYEYPVTLCRLANKMGAEKFLMISSLGADANSNIFHSKVKGEVEEEVKRIGLRSVHIFRPSLLLGDRAELPVGEKIAVWLSPLLKLVLFGRLRQYRPIPAKHVALAMVSAAQSPLPGTYTYPSDVIEEMSQN